MSKEQFFEMVDNGEFELMTLGDIKQAIKSGWVSLETAEIIAGVVLNC